MSEYANVERPFLHKLGELGWRTLDQGFGMPSDPSRSLRSNFREVTLQEEFKQAVQQINRTTLDEEWITLEQLDDLYEDITSTERRHLSLLEPNREVFEKLIGKQKVTLKENEVTGEKNPLVKLIDFEHWQRNSSVTINQFRVETPGGARFI